jgi:hypothetical protein
MKIFISTLLLFLFGVLFATPDKDERLLSKFFKITECKDFLLINPLTASFDFGSLYNSSGVVVKKQSNIIYHFLSSNFSYLTPLR